MLTHKIAIGYCHLPVCALRNQYPTQFIAQIANSKKIAGCVAVNATICDPTYIDVFKPEASIEPGWFGTVRTIAMAHTKWRETMTLRTLTACEIEAVTGGTGGGMVHPPSPPSSNKTVVIGGRGGDGGIGISVLNGNSIGLLGFSRGGNGNGAANGGNGGSARA